MSYAVWGCSITCLHEGEVLEVSFMATQCSSDCCEIALISKEKKKKKENEDDDADKVGETSRLHEVAFGYFLSFLLGVSLRYDR